MDNGKSDEPKLAVGLEGFLEGVEEELHEKDCGLGIVWSEEAACEKDGVSPPPAHMKRPVWSRRTGWKDGARMSGGIVLHAPEEDREIRDSSFPNRLGEAKIEAVEFTF